MKKQLNEIKRLQKIAGIITENVNEAPETPQQPVNKDAMIADLQKKYGPFVPITPEDKKELDYAGIGVEHGSIAVLKTKTPKMIPGFDEDDQVTKVSYLNILPADEFYDAPYYFEVRETVEYPGDFEQGEGNYGDPNGIWNGTTFEPFS